MAETGTNDAAPETSLESSSSDDLTFSRYVRTTHPSTPESPSIELFNDIFDRADKRDAGELSLSDFIEYFGDRAIDAADIEAIFHVVDSDRSQMLSFSEIKEFFSNGFEPFDPMFKSMYKLSQAITQALGYSFRTYPARSAVEQFKTRFYLREFLQHLQAGEQAVHQALETFESQTKHGRASSNGTGPSQSYQYRHGHQHTQAAATSTESDKQELLRGLQREVAQLVGIIDRLEDRPIELNPGAELVSAERQARYVLLVRSDYSVIDSELEAFLVGLTAYLRATRNDRGVAGSVSVFEAWESQESLSVHYTSTHFKSFQRANVDLLERPSNSSSIQIPAAWLRPSNSSNQA